MLGSAFPMFVAWGPALHTMYNDAYGAIMGAKHPAAISSRPLLIAATGWGQEDDWQKALAAGFDLHLTQPFDPLQLSAVISERVV